MALMFDDIPAFDDMPDPEAAAPQAAGPLMFDDIPAFDDIPQAEGVAGTAMREAAHAAVPAVAGYVGMGAGAELGAIAGTAIMPGIGTLAGTVIGGLGGMVAGSMAANKVQDVALKYAGVDDDPQRQLNREANPTTAFIGEMAPAMAGMSPVGIGGGIARQIGVRAAGGGITAGFEGGQEYLNEGHLDPTKIALSFAAGAVAPAVNKAGAALEGAGRRMVPGRPNQPRNPAADQAHADVADENLEVAAGESALSQGPVPPTGETTGNPQSAPTRSERKYGKDAQPDQPSTATSGQMDPTIEAAIRDQHSPPEQPDPLERHDNPQGPRQDQPAWRDLPPEDPRGNSPQAPIPEDAAALGTHEGPGHTPRPKSGDDIELEAELGHNATPAEMDADTARATPREIVDEFYTSVGAGNHAEALRLFDQTISPAEIAADPKLKTARELLAWKSEGPPQETGFPKEGEPVAMGANDAAPVPATMPAKAAKAIAHSKKAQATVAPEVARAPEPKPMPEIKGETPVNKSITEGQAKAGNYPKARSHDFGKPQKIETHADDVRTGKGPDGTSWEHASPYDYGYFNQTKGADKDHIDFARPREGTPEHGDKHFIVDQLNAETGKFDEHKVFTYYKDEASARKHYEAGFGDGKGAQRLGAITEVDRGGLVKFLAKHTSRAATKPYGALKSTDAAGVTAAVTKLEPKVVERAKQMMVEQGLPPEAIDRFMAMEPGHRAAEAAKFVNAKLSKTGVVKSAEVARIRPKAAEVPGAEGITARSKADAARKGDALAQMKKAMDDNVPAAGETPEALRTRLTKIVADAGDSVQVYKPAVKPASFQLIRQAKQMLLRKTWKPEHVESFNATEKLLRSGKEGAADARATNRIEADVARSRRSGDDAVAHAEAEQAVTRNTVEDDMIAAIDAKRGGKFDVPHEEAESMVEPKVIKTKADLPPKASKKVVDAASSDLSRVDTKPLDADAVRKLEAARLASKKAAPAKGESEGAASEGKQIKIVDPAEKARIMEMMNKAVERGKRTDTEIKSGVRDIIERFAGDTSGSFNHQAFAQAVRNALKTTNHKSYIAKTSKVPHSDYVRSVSDDLHTVGQLDKDHMVGNLKHAAELRAEFDKVFDPGRSGKSWMERRRTRSASDKLFADTMEKTYLAHEAGKLNILTPKERQFYDTNLKPTFDEINALAQHIHALNPDAIDPSVANHIYRISKNEAHSLFKRKDDDPTRPDVHMNVISTSANTAKERKFVAVERVSDGKRFVVSPRDGGYTLWQKYKPQKVKDPTFDFEAGKPFKSGNVDYIMRDAFTPEIEANARGDNGKPMQYYKNAALSAMMSHVQLASMARHLELLQQLRNDPQFKALSAREGSTRSNELGWEKTKLENFKGMTFDPHLRYVLDDYAKAGFDTPDIIRQMSQGVTKLLFWAPAAHMANVGAHWYVGRGWDWLKPTGYHSLVVDGMKAMKSVITQDHLQTQLREHGAGTIYGGVVAKEFAQKAARTLAEDIKRDPSKWGPIADKVGLTAEQLYKGVYNNSAKIMWAASDMFLTQRILELQRKGKSMKDAIIEAERDIPNYRIPSTIITEGQIGRFIQKMQADPAVLSFGRYHYGVFNSFANILKDGFGKDATIGDRIDAAGKMFAMATLALVVYPLWDKAVKFMTGNSEATAQRRGPMAVIGHVQEALEGKADIMKWARSTATLPPLTSTILETLTNRDFRGKQIVEPGDVRAAAHGDVKAAGRAVLQQAGHAAKGLISPYGTLANAGKKGLNPAEAVRDTLLDIKNPSDKGVKYQRMSPVLNERAARSRFKQGGEDPMERLFNKLSGYR